MNHSFRWNSLPQTRGPRAVIAAALVLVLLPLQPRAEGGAAGSATSRKNVIHIISDDLRPELGFYGLENRHTPNLDAMAADAVVFDRAYAQQAVCGPSRNSFLTGRRPDRSRSWNFINSFREDHPDWTSLPGLFLRNGALALGSGKTWHPKVPPAYDGAKSWSPESLPYYNPCWNTADNPNATWQDGGLPCIPCLADLEHYLLGAPISVTNELCDTDAYEDTFSVDRAVELLHNATSSGKQFYLGVGMHKPHIPYQASPADFALHPVETSDEPMHPLPPTGMPPVAFHFTDDAVHSNPWQPVASNGTRIARAAYRAAVTGMDRKLGKLFDEVRRLGIENETAFVFHSDHGYALGELGEWRKMTNFELATRVPLFVRAPWLAPGARSSKLVELVDIYPTIAELAGLPLPDNETLDGRSLVPLMLSTARSDWKVAAFSQYPRRVTNVSEPWHNNDIIHINRTEFTHMGYSIRTEDGWRYTEWVAWNGTSLAPIWSNVTARELYDHRNETVYPVDFDDASETKNVVADKANAAVVESLSQALRAQFGGTIR